MKENVIILGASNNPDRYSYLALKMLQEYKHQVLLVNPTLEKIEDIKVNASIDEAATESPGRIDTVTVYVNPEKLESYVEPILKLKPRRVIFNPGTESPHIESRFSGAGIDVQRACTLVLLRTNQY